ncbi:MAG TPA: hypothetical protein VJL87_01150 [Bdellovibrionota bacterium]|nr:hypothetical protein [Bdellovibrionota bacterium]
MKTILLLGDPVEHSFSPAMQNAAFRALNLPFQYEALRIPGDKFLTEIPKILSRPDLFGANITAPFKEKILPFVQPDSIST